jgi:hypothetical protein
MQFTSQLEQGDWYIMATWLCVVMALTLYGLGTGIGKLHRHLPRSGSGSKAPRASRTAPPARAAALNAAPPPTPPAAGDHWACVIEIVETGLRRAEATAAWHVAAHQQIDAAEYALNRLIAECAGARRQPPPEPADAARPLPAAAAPARPQPLAA